MKLRNKKTGEIESVSIDTFGVDEKDRRIGISVLDFNSPSDYRCIASYSSLAELNEEWEDYKPKKPLIKVERIRKIIRAWADENDALRVVYYAPKNELVDGYGNIISFNLIFKELKHCAEYSIDELCGEEEE